MKSGLVSETCFGEMNLVESRGIEEREEMGGEGISEARIGVQRQDLQPRGIDCKGQYHGDIWIAHKRILKHTKSARMFTIL